MMSNTTMIILIIIGVFTFAFAVLGASKFTFIADNEHKIRQCEKELPRNKNCVLIAVPEKATP